MRKRNILLNTLLGCALSALVCGPARAQNAPPAPRNFDPQQFRQMIMDRMTQAFRQALVVTDEQWAVLQPRVMSVAMLMLETRMQATVMPNMGGRRNFSQAILGLALDPPAQELMDNLGKASQALQDTLADPAAAPTDIMTKLQALRDAHQKVDQELARARASLRELLTPQQEAQMVLLGLLE